MSAQLRSPSITSALSLRWACTRPRECAAFRAKINNPTETRFIDSSGEWLMAHQVALESPGAA